MEPSPQRLERGGYLVQHVAACLGCHSEEQSDLVGAPVKRGTEGQGGFTYDSRQGMPGRVTASNITPDPEVGVGRWSDGELMRAIREGVDRGGRALFPMMPYAHYRSLSDEDTRAVVAYLRTLPPIRHAVEPVKVDFPVSLFIRRKPQPLDGPVQEPDRGNHVQYGRYLVTIGGCLHCHTRHDSHGEPAGPEGAGGWVIQGAWGKVATANITPDPETGLGRYSREAFVKRVKGFAELGEDPRPAPKGLASPMPWIAYSGMTEEDLGAIYDYLMTLPPVRNRVDTFPDAPKAPGLNADR